MRQDPYLSIRGVRVPRFLYGTAWKEGETRRLVALALERGFRGIDAANQRRHYVEADVGAALAEGVARGVVARADLFVQTKYTFRGGQDHRLPYDPAAPIGRQVEQSLASSLEHLRVGVLDSCLLHGPSQRLGLGAADREAWRAMEAACEAGLIRLLGASNVTREQLEGLGEWARIPPAFVQNRCYASRGWDRAVREFCSGSGIVYQAFSLLTANPEVLAHPELRGIAARHGRTPEEIVFRFALDAGMVPLTGTTDAKHMDQDLAAFEFELAPEEVRRIEGLV